METILKVDDINVYYGSIHAIKATLLNHGSCTGCHFFGRLEGKYHRTVQLVFNIV